jgi:hypothetical protein
MRPYRLAFDTWRPARIPEPNQVLEVRHVVIVMAGLGLRMAPQRAAKFRHAQRLAALSRAADPALDGLSDWYTEGTEVQQERGHRPGVCLRRDHAADAAVGGEPLARWRKPLVVFAERTCRWAHGGDSCVGWGERVSSRRKLHRGGISHRLAIIGKLT